MLNKKLYFGSNLKMYKTIKDTTHYLKKLSQNTMDISRDDIQLFIIPSFTALEQAAACTDQKQILLGAQNMCWEDQGQFTGELSPLMLKELGLGLVMAGHSERRHVFKETDIEENKKIKAALKHGFTALLCIGETQEQKDYGISPEILRSQIKVGLHGIPSDQLHKIWIAYEPVWSIGVSGTPATPGYAESMHKIIKETLRELFHEDSEQIPVLYGGSVNSGNAEELIAQPSIDGLFIGRAAWDADKFSDLIRKAVKMYRNC